jgi:polyhydroxyalkanoate synthase
MTTSGSQTPWAESFQKEAERNTQRFENLAELARGGFRGGGASTPRELVWSRRKAKLYHYYPIAQQEQPEPVVIVPWLGISRPTVLDLLPDSSLIRSLCTQGYHTYLLDWGEPGEEDADIGFEECSLRFVPRAINKVLAHSGASKVSLMGVCLGSPISVAYLALTPEAPVRNFISVVGPIDYDKGGMFRSWIGDPSFPVEVLQQVSKGVPTSLMAMGFKLLSPLGDVAAYSNLFWNLDNKAYFPGFQAFNDWANDFIPMPGRFFGELAQELYRENQLMKGQFRVGGELVKPSQIRVPVLVVAAAQDHIVPPSSARALMDITGSEDKEYVELPGGHISVFAGRQASRVLFPKIGSWLAARSA